MLRQAVSLLGGVSLVVLINGRDLSAQSVNIFGNAVPNNPIDDAAGVTIGVKFWSKQPGTISGIRFYRARPNSNGYTAKLYAASGSLLASARLQNDSCSLPCWETATFASPVSISPNTTYIASYYSSQGHGALDFYGLKNGVSNGPLTAPAGSVSGGNGVWDFGNVFPRTDTLHSNYYVDIWFTPTVPTPYLTLSFGPANPSIVSSAPSGTTVATINASWSDGSPYTGTLSFGPPYSNDNGKFAISGNQLIINPAGPGLAADGGTTQHATIVATQ
jgi:hypothetical protein